MDMILRYSSDSTGHLHENTYPTQYAAPTQEALLHDIVARKPAHATSLTQLSESPPILRLDEDVFAHLTAELLQSGTSGFESLQHLSLCCWHLRYLSLPALFSRCAIMNFQGRGNEFDAPPLAIRSHVRHLTYHWEQYFTQYIDGRRPKIVIEFGKALRYLPLVRSVAFTGAGMGIPWKALETCLSFPQVKAIEFTDSATFTLVSPFPTDAISACSGLEELSYPTPLTPQLHYLLERQTTLREVCALERACLSPLVLGMNSAARSLVLPMKTAPLSDMAEIDWPALQSLTLGGSFRTDADLWNTECLPSLFRHTPNLRRLNITAALPYPTSIRCSVLGCNAPPAVGLEGLRSLTIAYPDPNDAVYSTPFSCLVSLSLRDWPRHYDVVSHAYYRDFWRSPILSATEALSILRRLQAPGLASLELVYSADGADDDLLAFITRAFPKLRHLELHRYRQSSDETVDYQRIARTVSEISTLVTLRLNLDFQDDPGEGNDTDVDYRVLKQWRSQLSTIGWAVVDMLSERCPLLDGVALLYRGQPPAMWIWCLRSRQATRCCAYDRSPENIDTFAPPWPCGRVQKWIMRGH